ncbi:MAG: hypothetical protein GXY77_12155 [Fibrobacter sp.]|nr:hypothetical protein [Fibrobacter sp.]
MMNPAKKENRTVCITSGNSEPVISEMASLKKLCDMLVSCKYPYEDLAELIEDKAYEECERGRLETALKELYRVASFFEHLENKNEENSRDLADVYLLIGQIYQFAEHFDESIQWFSRAVVVDDQYPEPYHCLAISFYKQKNYNDAIKSLEMELMLAPGNYYSYLLLVDLYELENRQQDIEIILKELLERDIENIQGLHRLIQYYENSEPEINSTLLIKRLLKIDKKFSETEILIRSFYLYRLGKIKETLIFLDSWLRMEPHLTVIHLIRAYLFDNLSNHSDKFRELTLFRKKNRDSNCILKSKIEEFASVYGKSALKQINSWLHL